MGVDDVKITLSQGLHAEPGELGDVLPEVIAVIAGCGRGRRHSFGGSCCLCCGRFLGFQGWCACGCPGFPSHLPQEDLLFGWDLSTLADKCIQSLGGSNGVPVRRLQKGGDGFWGGVERVGKMASGTRTDAFKPLGLLRIEFRQTGDWVEQLGLELEKRVQPTRMGSAEGARKECPDSGQRLVLATRLWWRT